MRIALAQVNSIPGDFAGIVRRMLDVADRAVRLGADLLVFPTTLMGGVYPTGLGESQAFELDLLDALEDYAARTPVSSAVPAYVFDGEQGYTEVFLCEDGVAGPLRLRESNRPGSAGQGPDAVVASAFVAGVGVQFVVGDTNLSTHDADRDVIVMLSALPFCDQDSSTLLAPGLGDGALQGLVAECPCTLAVLQGVGAYDDTILAGGSFAASPEGVILAACPSFEEALVTFDVEPSLETDDVEGDGLGSGLRSVAGAGGTTAVGGVGAAGGAAEGPSPSPTPQPRLTTEPLLVGGPEGARPAVPAVRASASDDGVPVEGEASHSPSSEDGPSFPAFPTLTCARPAGDVGAPAGSEAEAPDTCGASSRPAGYSGVVGLVGRAVADVAPIAPETRTGLLWRALALATCDYVRKCGFSDVLVGLSGGIDSAVVAALAVDALGSEHVLGILMPGPYSSVASVEDAEALAANLGIQTRTVHIDELYRDASQLYEGALGSSFAGVAAENLQARLRGTTLMSLANARGALVLNTGNKSESGMGYSTLYGDTVGAYAPIGDVYKGRVYELARWRNQSSLTPVIPENVLVKAPSAELSEGQTDEASFGVSYPDIDRILTMHVERGMDARAIVAAGVDAAAVQRVLDACRVAEFKRRQEPMAPIVSMRPFVDRAWPIVLGWRDRADRAGRAGAAAEASDAAQGVANLLVSSLVEALGEKGVEAGAGLDDLMATLASDANPVADRLDGMLARLAHQDQIVSMLGDVAYSASIAGRGPDMDESMGLPLFSKN